MCSDSKSAFTIVGLIIFIVLIWITVVRWHDIKGSVFLNENSLMQTSGKIISSEIECRSGRYGAMKHFAIKYSYNVGENIYTSDSVTFAITGTGDGKMAEQYVRKYPVGKTVTVFYKNDEPFFSVLEPEIKDSYLIGIVIGLFILPVILIWSIISLVKENVYFG